MRLAFATTTLVFALFPVTTLAGKGPSTFLSRSRHADRAAKIRTQVTNTGGNPPYRLCEHYEGEGFFK